MPQRSLAEIHDYDALHGALRARADELQVSRLTIDNVAGLASGYCGKLLGAAMVKKIGPVSLGPILRVLGVKLVMVEDQEAIAALSRRLVRKQRIARRPRIPVEMARIMAENGRRGALALNRSLTPEARRQSAARAARARWGAEGATVKEQVAKLSR